MLWLTSCNPDFLLWLTPEACVCVCWCTLEYTGLCTQFMLCCVLLLIGFTQFPLQWRHNERHGLSNHQPHDCLLNRLFMRRSKKNSKLRVTGLCAGNSSVTGEFPAQRSSNAENAYIWWRHHAPAPLYWQWSNPIITPVSEAILGSFC